MPDFISSPSLFIPAHCNPLPLVFALLSVCRREGKSSRWRRRFLTGAGFNPQLRLSFWVHVCQGALLLDEECRPTPLVDDWLSRNLPGQMQVLLNGWLAAPRSANMRALRRNLLEHLRCGKPLGPAYQRKLPGLTALGIYDPEQGSLSAAGQALLCGKGFDLTLQRVHDSPCMAGCDPAWQLCGRDLLAAPSNISPLLWRLEGFVLCKHFSPEKGWHYLLSGRALRRAALQGNADEFAAVLEKGLQAPLEPSLRAEILQQPVVYLREGPLLEFSDPSELAALHRNSRHLRKNLNGMVSARHVQVDPYRVSHVVKFLEKNGVFVSQKFAPVPAQTGEESLPSELSASEKAWLLSLLRMVQESDSLPGKMPGGLKEKLERGLDQRLKEAAARQADRWVAASARWSRDLEEPDAPAEDLLARIQQSIEHEEALDVLYRRSAQHAPEHRHITPLLVESRAGRVYVLAYCHTRAANRTFRLDRMALAPPFSF